MNETEKRAGLIAARLETLAPGDAGAMAAMTHVLLRQPAPCMAEGIKAAPETITLVREVMAGGAYDLTQGATQFHLHTDDPVWARKLTPKALIGRYFYYAP
ncbi:MAG: hypothetical protein GC184_06770 [Rhizobiales bacterium]|nr:hypothetical protein [Hyphomicrobiales bacterium]